MQRLENCGSLYDQRQLRTWNNILLFSVMVLYVIVLQAGWNNAADF
jgi:hypothetical protein